MNLCPPIVFKWFDDNNAPAQGWKLYTYIAGSSTPVDTFTDSSGATENTNPIILDARGEARLWLDPSVSYKLVVTTPTGDPLSPEFTADNVTSAGGSVSGLSRVYYSDSSTIAFSGLGTLATPLSAQIKLSAYANNALQIRPDGLYAMAIGGGGSVAWGSITGSITAQSDLIAKFGEYLPLTFATPQVLNMTGGSGSTFVFANAGQFVSQSAIDNSYLSLHPNSQKIIWQASNGTQSDFVFPSAPASARTWTLPNASGTIALTSDIPSVPVLSVFGRTGAVTAQVGDYSSFYQPLDSDLTAIAGLTANGLLRKTAGVWGMDSNTYLTGNQTITLSGEVTGSGATAITTTVSNSAVIGKVLTGFSATNSAIVATDTILQGFNKAQGQINALVTADGTFIKRDGTSTTTATIPFAVGVEVGDSASGLAIRLTGSAKWIGSGTNPTTGGSALLLDSTSWILRSNTGNTIRSTTNNIEYSANGGTHNFANNLVVTGSGAFSSTLKIGSIPTGTQVGLLGYDASGNIIQGSASGGATWGSITGTLSAQTDLQTALNGKVNITGHTDLTTPWSIGDASTWGTSGAGVQIDPVGAYGLYLKGNAIIEQAVSQALTLYRPVTSGDICLNYDAQDSLGAQSSYAQVCGVVVSNTAGSVGGGLDLEVAIAGVLTPILQLRQAGSTLSSALSVSGAGCSVNTNTSDQGYIATSSAFTNGGLFLGRSSRGTIASPTALQSGDTLIFLGGQGYGATGYSALSRAVIRARTTEAWTDSAQGSEWAIFTTPNGSTTRAERGVFGQDGTFAWNGPVTLARPNTPQLLTLNASGTNVGTQIRFDNDATTSGWRAGISSDASGDWIIANDDLSTVPFRLSKSNDSLRLAGAAGVGADVAKNTVVLELGRATTPVPAWSSGDWLAMRFRGTGLRFGDLVYQPSDNRYLFTSNTNGTTDLNSLSGAVMGALAAASGVFSSDLTLQSNLLINNPTDTFAYTIVGGAITANRQLNIPVITATDTLAVLGLAQTFGAAQTARAWALTGQTNTPTGTTYTWTLTSGNQLDITLTSSTGDVTITTASPSAGATSVLSATGHGTNARNLTITQSGVTFIMAGKTSGNSILLDSIPATKRACYMLFWITTTKCFINRIVLEA